MDPLHNARTAFIAAFGAAPTLAVQAPGRVNLIGEHTDYNDGFVLPCAINYRTVICGSPRDDGRMRVVAADYADERDEFVLNGAIAPRDDRLWANYVRGVVKYLQEAGHAVRGADLAISGNVPQGAGLSSSASLEVATGQLFKALGGLAIDPTELALIGQRAENRFVGCNCGIMDQLISARGEAGHALLIDCRSLATQSVAMPDGIAVVIVNSNVQRGLVGSEYNTRRRQCEEAARFFGVKALRDVNLSTYEAKASGLDPIVARRARHIITDSQRAVDLAAALPAGDMRRIGQLMAARDFSIDGSEGLRRAREQGRRVLIEHKPADGFDLGPFDEHLGIVVARALEAADQRLGPVIHVEALGGLEVGNGLGLLLEDQHPVAVLERGRGPVRLVIVVEGLRRGRQCAAIFAAGAGIGLDELAHRPAFQH